MVALLFALSVATSSAAMEHVNLVSGSHDSTRALTLLPRTLGLTSLFEQVAGPVVVHVEESGGFAEVDPEKISIFADSWTWTRWYVDGLDVSDLLFDGAAGFHVPYPSMGTASIVFDEDPTNRRRQGVAIATTEAQTAGALVTLGGAGGRFFLADAIMDVFSGKHVVDRTPPPPTERRRHSPSYDLYLAESAKLATGRLAVSAHAKLAERRYLSFAWDGTLSEIVPENAAKASLFARYRPDAGDYEALFLAEVVTRDLLFAEIGVDPSEASRFAKHAFLAGIVGEGGHVALSIAHYDIAARDRRFARDVVDPDGEALFPFEPDGSTLGVKLDFGLREGPFYVWAVDRALLWTPDRTLWSQPATYRGEPYGTWRFASQETTTILGDHRAGVQGVERGPVTLHYDLFASATHASNRTAALTFLDVGLRARATFPRLGPVTPFVAIAKTPMPITVDFTRRIDANYLRAALRRIDGGTDELVDASRLGIDDNLTGPNVYRAAIGLDVRISDHWRFGAQGLFKTFRGMFRIELDGDAQRYGTFEDGVFFWNDRPRRYLLDNEDDVPAYFGLHLDLTSSGFEDLFFTASFSAYNAIGESAFGNGATANDLGVVSYASANPNAQQRSLAALDVDRAFMFKLAVAYQVLDDLWISATLRHRDGQPFAFLDTHEKDGQVALTYHSNRGSPLQYNRPLAGPREDFQLGADVQVSYTWRGATFWLLVANLLDMENEIREVNGAPGIDGRAALETQLPRSILFGFSLE